MLLKKKKKPPLERTGAVVPSLGFKCSRRRQEKKKEMRREGETERENGWCEVNWVAFDDCGGITCKNGSKLVPKKNPQNKTANGGGSVKMTL